MYCQKGQPSDRPSRSSSQTTRVSCHNKRNKQVGTVIGALLGGSIGADIARENRYRHGPVSYHTEQVCTVVNEYAEEERLAGYRVRYRYAGETYTTRMNRDPGDRLRVRVRVTPAG